MKVRKMAPWVAAALLAAVLVGCGGGGSSAPDGGSSGGTAVSGDPARGRELFAQSCTSCHGMDGKGMAGLGKNLVDKSDWMKKQDDAALIAFIKKGRPISDPENTTGVDMPPKGGNPALTDEDIADIVAWLRSVQQ